MDVTKKFSGRENLFAKFRPGYPPEYIDYLLAECDLRTGSKVADIGSGTGKLTLELLERNLNVTAVEPNDDMRLVAESLFKVYPNAVSVNATAEHTTIPDNCMDVVTVGQAFHWFNPDKFKVECKRILKQNGKVALVWNSRVTGTDFEKECARINYLYCPDFKGFPGGKTGSTDEVFSFFFKDGVYEFKEFPNNLNYDLEGFIGRSLSASYALKENNKNYKPYISALKDLFAKYKRNNIISFPNITRSYLGIV